MKSTIKTFLSDESGAITVDWVVLTAAILGLGLIVIAPIAYSSNSSASRVANSISSTQAGYGN